MEIGVRERHEEILFQRALRNNRERGREEGKSPVPSCKWAYAVVSENLPFIWHTCS